MRQALLQRGQFDFRVFVAAFGFLLHALNGALAGFQIGERQLGVDHVDIFRRIHFARDVNDVFVLEAAHHVADRFGFADVGQELVAQAFTFRRAFYQARDVDELHGGRHQALRFDDLRQLIKARIRHRHHAGVGLNGAEGEVSRFDARFSQRVEQGGFTDVRQAHDTAFESHGWLPF